MSMQTALDVHDLVGKIVQVDIFEDELEISEVGAPVQSTSHVYVPVKFTDGSYDIVRLENEDDNLEPTSRSRMSNSAPPSGNPAVAAIFKNSTTMPSLSLICDEKCIRATFSSGGGATCFLWMQELENRYLDETEQESKRTY